MVLGVAVSTTAAAVTPEIASAAGAAPVRSAHPLDSASGPQAIGDTYSDPTDAPLHIAAPGVLGNDVTVGSDPLTAQLTQDGRFGTVSLQPDGSFDYAPTTPADFDSFSYTVTDTVTGTVSDSALVQLVLTPAPTGLPDSYATTTAGRLIVNDPGVLANDPPMGQDILQTVLVQTTAHGTLGLDTYGAVDYTPDHGFQGQDTFLYEVKDFSTGLTSDPVTATITVTKTPQQVSISGPSTGSLGGDYPDVTGFANTGTAPSSGLPVNITVAPTSDPGVCSLSGPATGPTVTYNAVGSCVLQAAVAGNGDYSSGSATLTIAVTVGDTPHAFGTLAPGTVIVTDPSGTPVSDPGQVVAIAPDGTQTQLISGMNGSPTDVARDAQGDIYVSVVGDNRVIKVTPAGVQTTVSSGLSIPFGINVDSQGNVYIADTGNQRVLKIAPDGTQTTFLSGFPVWGIAFDGHGDVFVTDTGHGQILEIAPDGTQSVFASGFTTPTRIAVDGSGNVYVADTTAPQVYKITPAGVKTPVGTGITQPVGVAVDSQGNVYIANTTITKTVIKVAPDGTQTSLGTGLRDPYGVTVVPASAVAQTVSFGPLPTSVTYGAAPVSVTASSSAGLPVTITASGSCSGTGPSPLSVTITKAGSCSLRATQSGDAGHAPASVSGGFTVAPKPLTATVTASQAFGGTGLVLTPGFSGLAGSDTAAAVSGTLVCTVNAPATLTPGSYTGRISACSGLSSGDYAITYAYGSLTVTPAVLTVTASSPTSVFGAAVPAITATYTGFVNGNTATSVTTKATCSTTARATSNVGTYPTTCSGAAAANYSFRYVAGTATVTRAALTVRINGSQSYGGAGKAYVVAAVTGLVNGNTGAVVTGTPVCSTSVAVTAARGTYNGAISGCSGLSASNYAIAYASGTFTVNAAPLTIAASSGTMIYRGTVPTITPTYTGFVNGNTAASLLLRPTCRTTATTTSAVGSYPSTCTGALGTNYTITYVAGTVSVTPAATVVTSTGPAQVVTGATFSPAVAVTSAAATCLSRPVVVTLDTNPVTGASGPYPLVSLTTNTGGTGTGAALRATGWTTGVHLVTLTVAATANCAAASSTTVFAVTSTSLVASGAGTFSIPGQAAPVTFGFTASSASAGQLTLVQNGNWRFVATLTSYTKTSATRGTLAGTGTLSFWNTTTGTWQQAATAVPFTATAVSTAPGTFGITISYTPAAGQPTVLPNTAGQALASGKITVV